jgi:predicted transglutaminase-like cysteine proteinase
LETPATNSRILPKDKAKLQKVEKAINREIDRQKKSENHSKKDKGAQR